MLSRFERAIERIVEGSVAGVFRLRVQPAEIGRRLERAMLDGRVSSVGSTLGPNAFDVRLNPDDASSFEDWEAALCRELERWLAELAFARGFATIAPIRVQMAIDPSVPRRTVQVAARFDGGESAELTSIASTRAGPSAIWLIPRAGEPVNRFQVQRVATVGRADDNDLIIPVSEVSRHHARLAIERGAWRVVDLESKNGTWLNGKRIVSASFDAGDELAFAGISFTVIVE
jgi:hypothetical protein